MRLKGSNVEFQMCISPQGNLIHLHEYAHILYNAVRANAMLNTLVQEKNHGKNLVIFSLSIPLKFTF